MAATMTQSNQGNLNTDNSATSYSTIQKASQDVGLIFVREYYTFLNKSPHRLHAFYSEDSLMIRGDESEESVPTCVGQEAIRRKIEAMDFEDCRVLVTQVDSQRSAGNGILVQVLGEMCNRNGPVQRFSQTFFLAPQPNGYYVLNDILRFLKDDANADEDLDEEESGQQQAKVEEKENKEEEKAETLSSPLKASAATTKNGVEADHATESAAQPSAAEPTPAQESNKAQTQGRTQTKAEPNETERTNTPLEDAKPKHRSKPAKSEAPKTWAVLAAGNDVSDKTTQNAQSAAPSPSSPAVSNAAAPTIHDGKTSPAPGQVKPHAQTSRRNTGQSQGNKEFLRKDDVAEIFVKNVVKTITAGQLKEAFASFGTVENVTVVHPKNCAFVQFASQESCQKALAQNKVTVGDTVVLAEERRPQGYKRQQQNGNFERRFPPNGYRRGGKPRGGPAKQ